MPFILLSFGIALLVLLRTDKYYSIWMIACVYTLFALLYLIVRLEMIP